MFTLPFTTDLGWKKNKKLWMVIIWNLFFAREGVQFHQHKECLVIFGSPNPVVVSYHLSRIKTFLAVGLTASYLQGDEPKLSGEPISFDKQEITSFKFLEDSPGLRNPGTGMCRIVRIPHIQISEWLKFDCSSGSKSLVPCISRQNCKSSWMFMSSLPWSQLD